MKRFWVSWWQPTSDERPLTYPPNQSILGWWNSGQRADGAWSICAVVVADADEQGLGVPKAVKDAVLVDWPEAIDWRFCEEMDDDYVPGDRFPLSPWMRARFSA